MDSEISLGRCGSESGSICTDVQLYCIVSNCGVLRAARSCKMLRCIMLCSVMSVWCCAVPHAHAGATSWGLVEPRT